MKGKEGARKVALGKLSDRVAVLYSFSSPFFLSHYFNNRIRVRENDISKK